MTAIEAAPTTSGGNQHDEWYKPSPGVLEQAFIKDPDRTIEQLRTDLVGVIGENVEVRRFARFQLGETTEEA